MGGVTSVTDLSNKYKVTQINSEQIVLIQRQQKCNLVKYSKNNQNLQQYQMVLEGLLTLEEQLQFYQYRKHQNKHLVKVQYVRKSHNNGLCAHKQIFKVYTERIHIRLNQINDLNFIECLVILVSALDGLNTIKETYQGLLNLNDGMIGINERGMVKVWINQNYQQNLPDHKNIMKGYYQQGKVIKKLFDILEERTTDKQSFYNFKEFVQNHKCSKYEKSIELIREYINNNDIYLPRSLKRFCILKQLKQVEQASPFQFQVNPVPMIPVIYFQPNKPYSKQKITQLNISNKNNTDQHHSYDVLPFHNNFSSRPKQYLYNPKNYLINKSQSSNNTTTSTESYTYSKHISSSFHKTLPHQSHEFMTNIKNNNVQSIEDLSLRIKNQLQDLKKQLSLHNN